MATRFQKAQFALLNWVYEAQLKASLDITYIGKYDCLLHMEDGSVEEWHVGPRVIRWVGSGLKAKRPVALPNIPLMAIDCPIRKQVSPTAIEDMVSYFEALSFAGHKAYGGYELAIETGVDKAELIQVYHHPKGIVLTQYPNAYWSTKTA